MDMEKYGCPDFIRAAFVNRSERMPGIIAEKAYYSSLEMLESLYPLVRGDRGDRPDQPLLSELVRSLEDVVAYSSMLAGYGGDGQDV